MKCFSQWAPVALSLTTACFSGVVCIVSLCGNLLIIIVIAKDPLKKLRTPFNYFVSHLAVCDLIVGSFTLPISVYTHILESTRQLDESLTKVFHMSFFISVTASVFSISALSVDRYIAIMFAVKYRQYLTWKRCRLITVGIWIVSFSIPLAYLKIGYVEFFFIYTNVSIFFVFVILLVTYLSVERFLRAMTNGYRLRSSLSGRNDDEYIAKRLLRERGVTRTFIIVSFMFISIHVPTAAMVYVLKYCTHCDCGLRHILRDVSFVLVLLNSCMNIFIYAVRLKVFRRSIKKMFTDIRRYTSSTSEDTETVTLTAVKNGVIKRDE